MDTISPILELVQCFQTAFTKPSFVNFSYLLQMWLLNSNRHTVSGLLLYGYAVPGMLKPERHFSVSYNFFSKAKWQLDELGHVMLKLLLPFLGEQVLLIVDDTLCRRGGPKILGAGMHHDPLKSTYGGKQGRQVRLAYGVSFVVIAVWVPFKWIQSGGLAVPVLFRLYRPKNRSAKGTYRKRTQLAAELLAKIYLWLKDHKVTVTADTEYACQTVLKALPIGMNFVGPIPKNARLHNPEVLKNRRHGRPRVWGERIPSPEAWASSRELCWQKTTVNIYGREVTVLIKEFHAVWVSAGPGCKLKIILIRDPKKKYRDMYLFTTDTSQSKTSVLETYSRRWSIEVMFRDSKQYLGVEEPANGWSRSRRRKGKKKKSGPQGSKSRKALATSRTVPFIWIAYGLVVNWYLRHGQPEDDLSWIRKVSPWYNQKETISFRDMLFAFRKARIGEIFSDPSNDVDPTKIMEEFAMDTAVAG